jgi:hypothetical protein
MTENERNNGAPSGPRFKLVLIGFALIAGFFLIAEHRAHVWYWLPWLILAACPLMHLFMHHGNGDHDHPGSRDGSDGRPDAAPGPGSTAAPGPGIRSGSTSHRHGERS